MPEFFAAIFSTVSNNAVVFLSGLALAAWGFIKTLLWRNRKLKQQVSEQQSRERYFENARKLERESEGRSEERRTESDQAATDGRVPDYLADPNKPRRVRDE